MPFSKVAIGLQCRCRCAVSRFQSSPLSRCLDVVLLRCPDSSSTTLCPDCICRHSQVRRLADLGNRCRMTALAEKGDIAVVTCNASCEDPGEAIRRGMLGIIIRKVSLSIGLVGLPDVVKSTRFPDAMSFPHGESWLHFADLLPFIYG